MNGAEQGPLWRPGDVIDGRYKVVRLAGRGGMGWVYQVEHLEWGIDLAMKQLRPDVVLTARTRQMFEKEAETWVEVGLHPNVCCCHYVRRIDGLPVVFADGDVTVKVTDFGLARARPGVPLPGWEPGPDGGEMASVQVSRAGLTPAYASPEQLRDKVVSRRTDVYSYAVSVLEMFTGTRLWQRGDAAGQTLNAYRRGEVARPGMPAMPAVLGDLLERCLHHDPSHRLSADPSNRPGSMAGIAAEISEIYQTAMDSAYPRTMPPAADLRADELNNRALSLLDLGRTAEAEAMFTAAHEADPRHLEATYNAGLRQWRTGAITDDVLVSKLEAARTASGDSELASYLLAEVHLERGALTTADELLRTVEHIAPEQRNIAGALRTLRSDRLTDARRVETRTMSWWPEDERWVTETDGRAAKYAPRTKIRYTADGQRALVASRKHIGLWDISSGQCLCRRDAPHNDKEIDVSADGRYALCGLDTEVRLWDLTRGRDVWQTETHEGPAPGIRYLGMRDSVPIAAVSLSADARIAATQARGGNVMIWDARTGIVRRQFGRGGHLRRLSPDGRFALITSDDTIQLWDTETGVPQWELHGVNGAVPAAITADGRTVAMARSCETRPGTWENIGLMDLATGQEVRTLTGHTRRVESLSWSSDGRWLLSGGSDGTARLWELAGGRCLRTFLVHRELEATGASVAGYGSRGRRR
ncbi:protein kinase [Nocardia cyriacigeorgica]|uniref:Protein kinase n=1 Tax=Nocardia cyriacigeorgica TaxID=135487 RepID=A0ABX0CMG6_9NOCA|nr:protein kinase [Nocardia cyriacigeorgica]NEW57709.1 protein kinase [Nocardia cyriacigeorgica]